ncbi:hypothetical protein M378DRAFT_169068 [Amanita muscaria Koide BX008]|uniref:Uncharacterized protein n=1 Tax=Amanita muscaria (strain Koide BX008) TaxID=946122 RepID=A0A0C2S9V2_AMAMK|nr:hypothetical protein M378DRAFT_169068 [Amanita muscaria Koide BX008]
MRVIAQPPIPTGKDQAEGPGPPPTIDPSMTNLPSTDRIPGQVWADFHRITTDIQTLAAKWLANQSSDAFLASWNTKLALSSGNFTRE